MAFSNWSGSSNANLSLADRTLMPQILADNGTINELSPTHSELCPADASRFPHSSSPSCGSFLLGRVHRLLQLFLSEIMDPYPSIMKLFVFLFLLPENSISFVWKMNAPLVRKWMLPCLPFWNSHHVSFCVPNLRYHDPIKNELSYWASGCLASSLLAAWRHLFHLVSQLIAFRFWLLYRFLHCQQICCS